MEDNRFVRAYQEYQREKETVRPPRNNAGRFECLRGDDYVSYPQPQEPRVNRFSCLVDEYAENYRPVKNDIVYLPRETFGRKPVEPVKPVEPIKPVEPVKPIEPIKSAPPPVVYLPRPTPKIETHVTPAAEPWRPRAAATVVQKPVVTPAVTFDSNYHFPELIKTTTNKNIVIPESKKEMITKTVVVPIQKPTMTLLSFENGKMKQREVFEDGTEVPETGIVMIKKPNYSSWASVLKPETTETIYYDLDDKKIIDVE